MPEEKSKWPSGGWVLGTIAGAGSLLGGLVLIAEHVEKLALSRLFLLFILIGDYFRWEIVAVILVALFRRRIAAAMRELPAAIRYVQLHYRQPAVIVALVGPAVLAAVIAYTLLAQLPRYLYGKALMGRNYSVTLVSRAHEAYADGASFRARLWLRVGSEVLDDATCTEMLSKLNTKLARAALLRQIIMQLPMGSARRVDLIRAVERLDRRKRERDLALARERRALDDLSAEFRRGVFDVRGRRYEDAQRRFAGIERRFPGFGDVQLIRKDLEGVIAHRRRDQGRSYLAAMLSGPVDAYVQKELGPWLWTIEETRPGDDPFRDLE